jgi:hypothetical protein
MNNNKHFFNLSRLAGAAFHEIPEIIRKLNYLHRATWKLLKISYPLIVIFAVALSQITSGYGQLTRETGYEWLKDARIFIVDGYNYPLCPGLEFNADSLAGTMADMHANVLRIATSGHCGWMIPGTKFQVTPELGSRDILAESIAACKPYGIRVIPYINTSHTQKTSMINPDWAQKLTPAGDYSSSWSMGEKVTPICFNSSYREAFYDLVRTVVSKYDIDGIYFDTWIPFYFFGGEGKICYCDGCRKGFRTATGMEIPYRENSAEYTHDELKTLDLYRSWWKEEFFKVFTETRRIVKSNKDIPLIYNINDPETIMNTDNRIMEGTDGFLYERGRSMIERAEGVSLATAHGFSVWPYVGTYDPFPRIPHFSYELGQEIFTSVAFGGSPVLYHTYFFTEHPEARGIIKNTFGILDDNDRYIHDFASAKFCAVIWNDEDPPGHAVKGGLWDTNARLSSLGTFSACIHEHIQTTSMLKQDLDNYNLISTYKVLVLPDICYLSDRQAANITRFVDNGGGLIMTYATSLYDENGNKQTDFSLGRLAGIRYHSPDSGFSEKIAKNINFGSGWDIYLKTRKDQAVIGSPLAGELIPAHLFETADTIPGGNIIADIVAGNRNVPITPGVVVSKHGKGKVAYISAATGDMFQQTGIMKYADFLKDIISYVSPERLPYEIESPPSTLITNMTELGNKRVIHLIVWTGNQNERMCQNVYYIPEIKNVTIKYFIPDGKKIRSVSSFVASDIKQKQEKGVLYITLPYIDRYQALVIEME